MGCGRIRATNRATTAAWTTRPAWPRSLERGLFDGLFIADTIGSMTPYPQSVDVTLRESVQLPINDPTLVVPAMAR
ncbi:hypothetical protein [Comamonas sp. JC664]|uniref:hypothetical protein n=1 Tax=Comamonas sp. JC664 TaxID=2801917 RepID=UPI00360C01A0